MSLPRALNLFRGSLERKGAAFNDGFRALGFDVVQALAEPRRGDVLLTWNRTGGYDEQARYFKRSGGTVLVSENGYLGKAWRDEEWVALALDHHAGAGNWRPCAAERWDSWRVDLAPYRTCDGEAVVFAQRGIGEPGIKSPDRWAEVTAKRYGGRIRSHPGKEAGKPLEEDLANARHCFTWNSGAALKALMLGVPVWCDFPQWIGAGACKALSDWPGEPKRDESARLEMFRRLAWAQWTLDEIRTGGPIARLVAG